MLRIYEKILGHTEFQLPSNSSGPSSYPQGSSSFRSRHVISSKGASSKRQLKLWLPFVVNRCKFSYSPPLSFWGPSSYSGSDSEYIQDELAEIIANHEYELSVIPQTSYMGGWTNCFAGSLSNGSSNIRRTLLGIVMQAMQQLTGINFIFYFGNVFFTSLGTIHNPFLISLATSLVNMGTTPISFYIIERLGRRTILIYGAAIMVFFQFIVGIVGVTAGKLDQHNNAAVSAMIAFICLFIATFATTWGPAAWVVVGEIFPLPIRSRGVGLSTSSNWFWNCVSKHLKSTLPL
jgi:NADH:ubiquinone oxidoreductase subunit 6 (subunit J)